MPFDLDRTEIERIGNLVINFGWKIVKQEITADNITLTIQKSLSFIPNPNLAKKD